MKLRLAILLAVLGQLVAGGLCAAVCAPLLSPSDCAVITEAAPATTGCCSEPLENAPCESSPSSPRRVPPCCFSLPPVMPVVKSPSFALTLAPALELAPIAWTAPLDLDSHPITVCLTDPPGHRIGVHDRLASLCVWTI